MKWVSQQYGVPCKRGLTVRWSKNHSRVGKITSADSLIYVKFDTGRECYHPLELDYLVNGVWILGEYYSDLRKKQIASYNKRQSGFEILY